MKINCDLGEREEQWSKDQVLIPLVDQVNICCGAHAGSPELTFKTIIKAAEHEKQIGIHPGYEDRKNFGRVSLPLTAEMLTNSLNQQFETFLELCNKVGVKPSYIKPHGALYHDCQNREVLNLLYESMNRNDLSIPILLMSGSKERFQKYEIWEEAFLDRSYQYANTLMKREIEGSVFDSSEQGFEQYLGITSKSELVTSEGVTFKVAVDSLCIHGDSSIAFDLLEKINEHRQNSTYKS